MKKIAIGGGQGFWGDSPDAALSNYAGIWSDQEKSRIARQVICTGSGECCLELPVAAMEQAVLP